MAELGQYPMNGRTLAPTDTVAGVVTGAVADIPLSTLLTFLLGAGGVSGPSGNRPSPAGYVGQPYFDTTLSQPVFCKITAPTSVWVNAAGVVV